MEQKLVKVSSQIRGYALFLFLEVSLHGQLRFKLSNRAEVGHL